MVSPRIDYDVDCLKYNVSYFDEEAIEFSDCEWETYWNENGEVVLSQKAEKILLEATWELHNMALLAVDKVVNDDKLLELFGISK